jgi:ribonuclease P protein component
VLASLNRMRRKADFGTAVRRGRRAGTPRLTAHWSAAPAVPPGSPDPGLEPVRVGFVVSRAVGTAVVRNQVRRRLRALVRDRIGGLPDGGLLVVRAAPRAAGASSRELGDDLDRALSGVLTARAGRAGGRAPGRRPATADDGGPRR